MGLGERLGVGGEVAPRFFSPGTGRVNAGACTEVPSHGGDTGSPTESEVPLRWAIVYEEETDLLPCLCFWLLQNVM